MDTKEKKSTSVAYSIKPRTMLKAVGMTIKKYVKEFQPYITVDEELIHDTPPTIKSTVFLWKIHFSVNIRI